MRTTRMSWKPSQAVMRLGQSCARSNLLISYAKIAAIQTKAAMSGLLEKTSNPSRHQTGGADQAFPKQVLDFQKRSIDLAIYSSRADKLPFTQRKQVYPFSQYIDRLSTAEAGMFA